MNLEINDSQPIESEKIVTIGQDTVLIHSEFLNDLSSTVMQYQKTLAAHLNVEGAITDDTLSKINAFLDFCLSENAIELTDVEISIDECK